eukprot:7387812-Prymnesium_polylepis.3
MACLRVVRFRGSGLRETHELALCHPNTDGTASLVFSDRTQHGIAFDDLCHHLEVTPDTYVKKASVRAAIDSDIEKLRLALAGMHEEVRTPQR